MKAIPGAGGRSFGLRWQIEFGERYLSLRLARYDFNYGGHRRARTRKGPGVDAVLFIDCYGRSVGGPTLLRATVAKPYLPENPQIIRAAAAAIFFPIIVGGGHIKRAANDDG